MWRVVRRGMLDDGRDGVIEQRWFQFRPPGSQGMAPVLLPSYRLVAIDAEGRREERGTARRRRTLEPQLRRDA